MPLQKLQFRPGVNREGTSLANEGGWYDCDKIRFRSGYPEKLGGWTAISQNKFLGLCRSLWNWITLNNYNLVGVGTNLKFYVQNGGAYYDITPLRLTTGAGATPPTTAPTFTTTSGSKIVTVSDPGVSALQINDFVTFSGAATVGGLDLNNEYQIASVLSSTSYTIVAASNASSSVSGGGGAGTTAYYQIDTGLDIYTIGTGWGTGPWSPYLTTTLTNPFSTTNGSTTITVTQASHGLSTGNYVDFVSISASTVGGVASATYTKAFQVTVVNPNSYTISTIGLGSWATPTVTNASQGGTVVVNYPSISITASATRGWGVGYTTGIGLQLRLWSQANFGQELLFSPRGGALYIWDPTTSPTPAFTTRGTLVSGVDVPSKINEIAVSDATRIVIAFGCDEYGPYNSTAQDPLLIRWSAQEDYTDWTPSALNQAGSYRLSHGSYIVGYLQSRQEILVWTDAAIYSMQYLGPPYIYGFTLLADNISIASPNAMTTAAGVTYWMGTDKFYSYAGRVETLPCAVRTYVYNDINMAQSFQFFASTNEGFSEVWWFYCSANSTVIDKYVIFNYLDRVWYYGTLSRTAWLDSPLLPNPIAATSDNLLVYHESGADDNSGTSPVPIEAYVQSSDFDIGDGHNYGFVWQIVPDITFDGSTTPAPEYPQATFTIRPRRNPGANYGTSDEPTVSSTQSYAGQRSYNVQQFTQVVNARLRGRQMAFRISSNTLGTQWQLGTPRMNVRPDGRK